MCPGASIAAKAPVLACLSGTKARGKYPSAGAGTTPETLSKAENGGLAGGSGQGSKGMSLGVKSQVTSIILLISVSPEPTPGQGSDRRKSTKYREKQDYYQNARHEV